jgi:hypothetical protein
MIVPIVGCILAGCLQDVPVVVGGDPVIYHLSNKQPAKIDKSKYSCYIEGEFYKSCPK